MEILFIRIIQTLYTKNMQAKNLNELYFNSIFSFITQLLSFHFKLFITSSDFISLQISLKTFIH